MHRAKQSVVRLTEVSSVVIKLKLSLQSALTSIIHNRWQLSTPSRVDRENICLSILKSTYVSMALTYTMGNARLCTWLTVRRSGRCPFVWDRL